jgi:hypothetical protein
MLSFRLRIRISITVGRTKTVLLRRMAIRYLDDTKIYSE